MKSWPRFPGVNFLRKNPVLTGGQYCSLPPSTKVFHARHYAYFFGDGQPLYIFNASTRPVWTSIRGNLIEGHVQCNDNQTVQIGRVNIGATRWMVQMVSICKYCSSTILYQNLQNPFKLASGAKRRKLTRLKLSKEFYLLINILAYCDYYL